MKLEINNILTKIKIAIIKLTYILIIATSLGVGFIIGYYHNMISDIKLDKKQKIYSKSEINIAVDENNNLLLINRFDGTYTMYEDSIGYTIFNLYARNMFGTHNIEEKK